MGSERVSSEVIHFFDQCRTRTNQVSPQSDSNPDESRGSAHPRQKKASIGEIYRHAKIWRVSNVIRPYMEEL